jgi:hypothetical protein
MPKITIEYTPEEMERFPQCVERHNTYANAKDLIVIVGEACDDQTMEYHVILCYSNEEFLPESIRALVGLYAEEYPEPEEEAANIPLL